ncbi:hypothetical protein DPMN_059460 [Dreissena polymorpha]|uniref:Secreted protein n=1 Tax=Dreissena polymorpha TaxID=45954 RepID=A0A9D4C408_DREPO|nr:hypothetical protein DPMN_059460 [Dreissena polymorpha]
MPMLFLITWLLQSVCPGNAVDNNYKSNGTHWIVCRTESYQENLCPSHSTFTTPVLTLSSKLTSWSMTTTVFRLKTYFFEWRGRSTANSVCMLVFTQ